MSLMSKNSASFLCAAALFVGLLPNASMARNVKQNLNFGAGYENAARITGDGDGTQLAVIGAPALDLSYVLETTRDDGARTRFTSDIEVTGPYQFEDPEVLAGLDWGYQRAIGDSPSLWFRLSGTYDVATSPSRWAFQRQRLTLRIQNRISVHHTVAADLRFGYRNQNEDTFEGYDQWETRSSLTHTWHPPQSQFRLSGTVHSETRSAQFSQFSYDEVGIASLARLSLSEQLQLTARASFYTRDFQGAFSTSNSRNRSDERLRGSLELNVQIDDGLSTNFNIGYDHNQSNIPERDYSGPTFGLAITRTF